MHAASTCHDRLFLWLQVWRFHAHRPRNRLRRPRADDPSLAGGIPPRYGGRQVDWCASPDSEDSDEAREADFRKVVAAFYERLAVEEGQRGGEALHGEDPADA